MTRYIDESKNLKEKLTLPPEEEFRITLSHRLIEGDIATPLMAPLTAKHTISPGLKISRKEIIKLLLREIEREVDRTMP